MPFQPVLIFGVARSGGSSPTILQLQSLPAITYNGSTPGMDGPITVSRQISDAASQVFEISGGMKAALVVTADLTFNWVTFDALDSADRDALIELFESGGRQLLAVQINGVASIQTLPIDLRALQTTHFLLEDETLYPLSGTTPESAPLQSVVNNESGAYSGYTCTLEMTGGTLAGLSFSTDGNLILPASDAAQALHPQETGTHILAITDPSSGSVSRLSITIHVPPTISPGEGGAPNDSPDAGGQGGDTSLGSGGEPTSGDGDGDGDGISSGDGDGDGDGDGAGDGDGMPSGVGGMVTDPDGSPTGGTDSMSGGTSSGTSSADDGGCGCHTERRAPGNFLWVTPAVLLWLRMRRPIPRRPAWWRIF